MNAITSGGFAGRATLVFAASHRALPGHFPGTPIVPGVLLLAESLARIGAARGAPLQCRSIVNAKFLRPVAPDEVVTLDYNELTPAPGRTGVMLQLALHVAGAPVAQVRLELAAVDTASAHD